MASPGPEPGKTSHYLPSQRFAAQTSRTARAPSTLLRLAAGIVPGMSTVTWLPRTILMGAPVPHQYGAAENGLPFVMIREHARGTNWRVSLYPDGNPDNAIESVAGSERQAKRFIERWASGRTLNPREPERSRGVDSRSLPPRKPKGLDDRS